MMKNKGLSGEIMRENEKNYHVWVAIIMFFGLLFVDKTIEAILMLIVAHLIELKYELRKITEEVDRKNKMNKLEIERLLKPVIKK